MPPTTQSSLQLFSDIRDRLQDWNLFRVKQNVNRIEGRVTWLRSLASHPARIFADEAMGMVRDLRTMIQMWTATEMER